MCKTIETSRTVSEANPVELFLLPRKTRLSMDHDVTADGQRFLVLENAARESEPLTVLITYQESLKGK